MPKDHDNKIDFYAQPGVEYIYIVFKVFKKSCGGNSYSVEAEKIEKLLNTKNYPCDVKSLFITDTAPHAPIVPVDEKYGFNRYFKVVFSDDCPAAHLINAILQVIAEQDFIELVYPAGKPMDASVGIADPHGPPPLYFENVTGAAQPRLAIPNFFQYQYYLWPPSVTTGSFKLGGIDVEPAWAALGGDGRYVTILSHEISAWYTNHINLPHERAFAQGAIDIDDHDTSAVGVMAARRILVTPTIGIVGIAYNARVAYADSPIEALRRAYDLLNPGDVVQVGLQLSVGAIAGCTAQCWLPMEYENARYDLHRALTDKGIHVILAAGNGGIDLDHTDFNGKFDRNVRDSGAIFVGGITPSTATRAYFSDYGSRIDSSSWGYSVVTTAYGSGNLFNEPNAWYKDNFSGTSSANPIVAGAAACLSSIAKAYNKPLPPRLLREIFTRTGTPFLENNSAVMGTQPYLWSAIGTFLNS